MELISWEFQVITLSVFKLIALTTKQILEIQDNFLT